GAAEAIAEPAIEVAATANPTVRAKSRRVITDDIVGETDWTCKSSRSAGRPPDVAGDHVVHLAGCLGRIAHDVVAVIHAAHLNVFKEGAGCLELFRISFAFAAEPVELCGDDQSRRDTGDVVAVGAPSRRGQR